MRERHAQVGPYAARGAVRLLFKGGNVVTFVKRAAVRALVDGASGGGAATAVGRLAGALQPAGNALSDVDWYVMLASFRQRHPREEEPLLAIEERLLLCCENHPPSRHTQDSCVAPELRCRETFATVHACARRAAMAARRNGVSRRFCVRRFRRDFRDVS